MTVKIHIDGVILDPDDAKISVFDRGFLYGDSVYEVMRTAGGRAVAVGQHLERLERSAANLALTLPAREHIAAAIDQTLAAAQNPESYVRVIVTRGAGEIGLAIELAESPSLIVIVRPLVLPPPEAYERGVALRVVQVQRVSKLAVDPSIKSGNYLNNIMALREARAHGAYEALMCDALGRVAEGSSSNLFVVRDGRVVTPALDVGLLRGITRDRVIALARGHGLDVHEDSLTPDQVRGADEAFITSSIRGVLPVHSVDDARFAVVPGPITRTITALYADYLVREAHPG